MNLSGIAVITLMGVVVYQGQQQSDKSSHVLRTRSLELVGADGSVLALSRASEGRLRIGNKYGEFELQLAENRVGIRVHRADEHGAFAVDLKKSKVNELFLQSDGRRGFSVELRPDRNAAWVRGPKSGGVAMACEKGNAYVTAVGRKDGRVFYMGSTPGHMGSQLSLYGKQEKRPFLVVRAGDKTGGAFIMRGRDGGGFQVNALHNGTVLGLVRGGNQPGFAIKAFGMGSATVNTYDEKGKPVDLLKSR